MSCAAMTRPLRVAAVDLGATSGRVMVGTVGEGRLELEEVHRFANGPVKAEGTLYWDILGIYRETLTGLRRAAAGGPVDAVGIDSWAVDYGLLGASGALVGNPVSHRDPRTDGVRERVVKVVPEQELYRTTPGTRTFRRRTRSPAPRRCCSSPTCSPTG